MSASNPPKDSDSQPGTLAEDARASITTAQQRIVSGIFQQQKSDLNYKPTTAYFDPTTKTRRYDYLPTNIPQRFFSPLKLGFLPYPNSVCGPHGEREVSSSWGDVRSVSYNNPTLGTVPDGNRRHAGMDYRAKVGEDVMASADGKVNFVGIQTRDKSKFKGNRKSVPGATVDADGNVLDANGNIFAVPSDLGHGGLYVEIIHNGDFQGFMTRSMHLSSVAVKEGAMVSIGDVIGQVGQTGGDGGITSGPHLHWQVHFNQALVNPETVGTYYKKGQPIPDSPDPVGAMVASVNATLQSMPAGAAVIANAATNNLQSVLRASALENKSAVQHKEDQASHQQLMAKSIAMNANAVFSSIAKFQGAIPKVEGAMTFNFETGLWSDGRPV